MKKIILSTTLLLVLIFLSACSSGGKDAVSLQTTYVYKMAGTTQPVWGKNKNFVAFIKRGELLKVLETHKEMNNWAKVQLSDGETKGWINKRNIFVGKGEMVTFTKAGTRFSRPDESSPSSKVKQGETAIVLRRLKNGWVKVNFSHKGKKYLYKGHDFWVREEAFEVGMVEVKPEDIKEAVSTGVGRGEVSASSVLKSSTGLSYSPGNAFDGVMRTTWQPGGSGFDEWIEVTFADSKTVDIQMINGFNHKDEKHGDLYDSNARIKRVRLSYGPNLEYSVTADLLDGNREYQQIASSLISTRFRITILDVYKGSKWKDAAISEIQINPASGGAPQ